MAIRRKYEKHCEGCRLDQGARFRTLANLFLCGDCYTVYLATGEVPGPAFDKDEDEREFDPRQVRW